MLTLTCLSLACIQSTLGHGQLHTSSINGFIYTSNTSGITWICDRDNLKFHCLNSSSISDHIDDDPTPSALAKQL